MLSKYNKHIKRSIGVLIITMLVSAGVYYSNNIASFLGANVLGFPEHAPFDGTVYPIRKAPNWVMLKDTEWTQNYSLYSEDKLSDLPKYDPSQLSTPTDTLIWGNAAHDKIRNAKITFPVLYLGTYKLDGLEGTGSHPAVDIKIPEGTPVYAIANGTVIKVSKQSSGFGYHIVIQHNNFPSLNDANSKDVIYSTYSHLGETLVSVNDVVAKGDQIALSGSTGTATTPHLHFQIDNSSAPWHPFWPFTWAQAQDANLDFFSAINAGLGRESAAVTTIHPMSYVSKYYNDSASEEKIVSDIVSETPVEEVEVAANPVEDVAAGSAEVVESTDSVTEVLTDESISDPDSEIVSTEDAEVVGADFSDVSGDSPYYTAIMALVDEGIVKGYPDGTFRPGDSVTRVEALKFIMEGIQASVVDGNLPFDDVVNGEWYAKYLYTAYNLGVVDGYEDRTFKPTNTVNKAEFYKILLNGMGVDVNPNVDKAPFKDVPADIWFAPYIRYAKDIGIIDPSLTLFNPSVGMTRGEVADAIYRLLEVVK